MSTGQTLGSRIVAGELMIQRLLSDSDLIGGIYTMGFNECVVLTNDLWKSRAGGVPQHCFLLATAMEPNQAPRVDDEEILLLRVVGPAALPAEAELVQLRAEAMREIVTERGSAAARSEGADSRRAHPERNPVLRFQGKGARHLLRCRRRRREQA